MLEFSIITIGSFVTMLDSITKYISKFCFKKDISRAIPIFSIIYGVALGICGFYTPNVEMGKNLIEAVFIGLSAGAAATGINQVGKQLNKKEDNGGKPIDQWTDEDWAKAREIILGIAGNTAKEVITDEDWAKAREIILGIASGNTEVPQDTNITLFGNTAKEVIDELDIKTEEEKENIGEDDAAPNEDYNEDE